MPAKGKKRTLERHDQSLPVPKRKVSRPTDDQSIVEAATISAAPTVKQLDPAERQRRTLAYKSFLNRGGPDAPGSKDIPQGAEGCLKSLTFVITGVLPSLEREECKKIIESYGGRVTTAVSGKTDFLLVGRDAGRTKTDKVDKLRIKKISEDDLLQMIRTRPGNSESTTKLSKPIETTSFVSVSSSQLKVIKEDDGILWVDKYKPTSLNQIVGQQTDKSPMKKLIYFLSNWHANHGKAPTNKRKRTTTIASTDPSKFKAVLLTGPPGVGKTITAQLVCKALDLPYTELNASDNRSQTTIDKTEFNSVYLSNDNQTMNKHVLIIDEVDGITGNEDRGGIRTLVKLIEKTRIPIIFIANDRQINQIRSLLSHCYEIKFDRPSFLNIKSFILELCSCEYIHIAHTSLDNLIQACNRDIRKIISTLNFYYKQSLANVSNISKLEKAISTSPFDVCSKMFSLSDLSINDKIHLYFHDYSFVPLLIQENYLRISPPITFEHKPMSIEKRLELISKAADSLTLGDMCSKIYFTNRNSSLLSYQSIFSGVLPTTYLHGSLNVVQFPSWLGFIQKQKTTDRFLIELQTHSVLTTLNNNRCEFTLDYLPILNLLFTEYLQKSNLKTCLQLMNHYYLNQDDVQVIFNLSIKRNQYQFNSKTKNFLTKSLNHRTPFKQIDINQIKPGTSSAREDDDDLSMIISDEDELKSDIDTDVIKIKSKRRKIK